MSDDEDLEYEEFLSMSDEQTDAVLERLMKEHEENIRQLNPYQLYCWRRRVRLDLCVRQRRLTKDFSEVFGPMLKATQRRLLEARIEFLTGAVSGHA